MTERTDPVTAPGTAPAAAARTALVQRWEESERGWGVRPDGYSLHLTEDDRARFVVAYNQAMPDQPPDEYSRPSGAPYLVVISEQLHESLSAARMGLRSFARRAPDPAALLEVCERPQDCGEHADRITSIYRPAS